MVVVVRTLAFSVVVQMGILVLLLDALPTIPALTPLTVQFTLADEGLVLGAAYLIEKEDTWIGNA